MDQLPRPPVNQTDGLAKGLINELNKVHASGQGLQGFTSVSASNVVANAAVSSATGTRCHSTSVAS